MAFASITVTGTYKQTDGVTASVGRVEFRLVNPGANTVDDEIIVPGDITADLDGTGSFSVSIPTSASVGGQAWQVVEAVDGYRRLYYVEIPDAGPVDMADLAPIGAAHLSATYVLAASLTLEALADTDLTGLADGDTITYDLATNSWVATTPAAGGGGGTDDQTAAEVPFTPAGGLAATDVQAALAELDAEKAASGHNHDGTYSPTAHNHDASYAATVHTHDDRYYTETEADAALAGKADAAHNHDGSYAATAHTHDTRYYTEAEVDTALAGKADSAHNHDGSYSPLAHNHDDDYQPLDPVLTGTTASFTTADEAKLDSVEAAPRRIFETALGVWTDDAPAGRSNYYDTIEFVGVTDPTDATNGIATPANMVAGDRWTPVSDFVA